MSVVFLNLFIKKVNNKLFLAYVLLYLFLTFRPFLFLIYFFKMVPPAELEDGETDGEADVPPPVTAVPLSPPRPPILWTAWVFFKAFFASLVPEAPQAMAN